ncbi:MAG TPA: hypothetical protein VNQ73_02540 [Ilumatobacter sp.]|nr:hypothetical protein [Ilumatobacter sp.]
MLTEQDRSDDDGEDQLEIQQERRSRRTRVGEPEGEQHRSDGPTDEHRNAKTSRATSLRGTCWAVPTNDREDSQGGTQVEQPRKSEARGHRR